MVGTRNPAPGVLEQMGQALKREADAMQQSHTGELKRLEAASKAREDQWRAREPKWETKRKSLQDRLLKAPKPQAGSGTVAVQQACAMQLMNPSFALGDIPLVGSVSWRHIPLSTEAPFLGFHSPYPLVRYPRTLGERAERG